MSGFGQYSLELAIVDPGADADTVEVWRARFTDKEDNSSWEVYFEMEGDYEVWDLIDEAISVYRDTIDETDSE